MTEAERKHRSAIASVVDELQATETNHRGDPPTAQLAGIKWALSEIERQTTAAKKACEKNKRLDHLLKNRWCPDVCPITLLPFFMWIDHPDFGCVPTYGGPHDSYTIPEPEVGRCDNRHDVEYIRYRYDHDLGGWLIGECEQVKERVVLEDTLIGLGAWSES